MNLIQELMNQAHTGGLLQTEHIKRFSPAEIREAIQTLVATEQLDLAFALGSAGMSIHPHSEDMLAMVALLTGGFLVSTAVHLSIVRQRAELALLGVLGASEPWLRRFVWAQGGLIGALGGVLGEQCGDVMKRFFKSRRK